MAADIYVAFGADTGGLEAALAVAKAQISAVTKEINKLGKEMQSTGAAAGSELGQHLQAVGRELAEAKTKSAELGAELRKTGGGSEEAHNGIAKLGEVLRGTLEPLRGVRENLGEIAELFVAAFAIERLAEWVDKTAELGEKMVRAGAEMGVTASEASGLAGMAKLTGTEFETLQRNIERLNLNLAKSGSESGPVAQGLKAIGLSAGELVGIPIPEQMAKIAEAVSGFADGGNKTAAVMALLGRSGAEMIPFLDRGREGIEELRGVLERTGAVMTNETAEAFAKTKEDISEMQLAWQGLSNRIYSAFNPAIDALIKQLTKLLENIKPETIKGWALNIADGISNIILTVGEFVIDLAALIKSCIQNMDDLGERLAAIGGAALAGGAIAGPLGAAFAGIATAIGESFVPQPGAEKASEDTATTIANFRKVVEEGTAGLKRALSGDEDHSTLEIHPKPKPQAGAMQIGGEGAAAGSRDVTAQFSKEVEDARDAAKAIEQTLQQQLQTHQITMQQWADQSKAALDKEADAIRAAAEKALATARLTAAQKITIAKEEQHQLAAIALAESADQAKAAAETAQKWQEGFATLNNAITGQIAGLLRGTTSLAQAMRNVLGSLIETLIKQVATWGLQWAESLALQAAGAATGAAAMKAAALSTIGADVGQAFAGFAANLAPLLGPAAIPAAAGLAAEVGAQATALTAFDIGAYQIPDSMRSILHRDELVMDAPHATAFRSMLDHFAQAGAPAGATASQNGGPQNLHVHFNVSAVDGASVKSFFKNNSKAIMKALNDGVVNGRHLGLAKLA